MFSRDVLTSASRKTNIAAIGLALIAPTTAASASISPEHPVIAGINLAGGEFNSARKPGIYAKDYIYPDRKVAAPFLAAGMQIVRVPILWERIQPAPFAPLADREMARLDRTIGELKDFRIIILDIHNYGRYRAAPLDRTPRGDAMLADVWAKLAQRYRGQPRIAFGLMNEPHAIAARRWRKMVDRSVSAIRRSGARNLILVPGTNWTGAASWTSGGAGSNAAAFAGFRDPGHNFLFEMHQYFDAGGTGTDPDCVDGRTAEKRVAPATAWLRKTGNRALLGEFGVGPNDQCLRMLARVLDHIRASPDAWMGWAYWAGGAWWGKYPKSVQPSGGQPKPQMTVLQRYIPSRSSGH
ncbi:glycosyl hydrolase family 5 [Sphingomonas oleivorans]|uniref:Glycosyl hydrolase family 5 n=1 Tax=Sphingomonas oleivorans TaxID=1735121 RepID=A0A2T5FZ56_9SPHN|nr:glycoside hydrolase family 5 protein [Sphingomonas oleivorans]PTQ11886.1 glycosyl hydrolase family 5 [Sphingomonas oleivorans]